MSEKNLYSFEVKDAADKSVSMKKYEGQLVLVVNVASKCGFTPQYSGLEELYAKYHAQGLAIVGFPSNQFGAQEPGQNEEIQEFCKLNYGVTFPVMAKVDVNGAKADPLYDWLKTSAPGILGTEMIKWNFTKFLVGKDGKVIKRYAPNVEPQGLVKDIEQYLK
ncbi:MAG: glutathione peroxidase [Bdellovibrionaceae bacterium]|nr:glutathione peroxidase [Pseudobdellovibrionaceae bacterium]